MESQHCCSVDSDAQCKRALSVYLAVSLLTPQNCYITLLLPATKLGQGYVFTGVCDSVHRGGGVCLSACWDTTPWEQTPPRSRHPPGAGIPPEQTSPQEQTPPDQTAPREQTPPQEQTPPESRQPALGADTPQEQAPTRADTPQEQTPPPPGQSMLGDTVNARAVRILLECNLVFISPLL